ncbi:MAG: MBL fold metallo-hydrolase [Thermoplasmata archaeon]|nr:MAG: MBL fold metallo-hydrolase [Thermoplasmata archaeon]
MLYIRWHGHACFEIANDNITLVTDPHDGKSIGIKPPIVKADVVLVSHGHFDHNSTRTVEGPNTKVITECAEPCEVSGVQIRSVQSYHDDMNGEKRGINNIFLFKMDGLNFCHLGDLGHIIDDDISKNLKGIDVLFIPVGNVFTINATSAWKVISKLKPIIIVPMHYRVGGLSLSIKPVDDFLEQAQRIQRVGNEIDFEGEDLSDEQQVWVFSL